MSRDTQLAKLREANAELERFLCYPISEITGTERELQALLRMVNLLEEIGPLLSQQMRAAGELEVGNELRRYRCNLLRLQSELAAMQGSAEARRAQMFNQLKHLEAARAWCNAVRTSQ